MGKHSNRKKSKKIKRIIATIFLIIFLCLMFFSGHKIITWIIENNQSKQLVEEVANTVTVVIEKETKKEKYDIDFKSLKEKNADVVAWLKVNGTNIEFPVVQGTNNYYYLTHSLDESVNSAGWIFMDYKNKLDGTDKNIVVYGHNRRDDSMFGTLKNILNEEWYENKENYIIPFITENKKSEYQVFSIYTVEAEDYYITTEFDSTAEYDEFIDDIENRSIKNFGINVKSSDNILTLSTCADNSKYRVVLHAKELVQD